MLTIAPDYKDYWQLFPIETIYREITDMRIPSINRKLVEKKSKITSYYLPTFYWFYFKGIDSIAFIEPRCKKGLDLPPVISDVEFVWNVMDTVPHYLVHPIPTTYQIEVIFDSLVELGLVEPKETLLEKIREIQNFAKTI